MRVKLLNIVHSECVDTLVRALPVQLCAESVMCFPTTHFTKGTNK